MTLLLRAPKITYGKIKCVIYAAFVSGYRYCFHKHSWSPPPTISIIQSKICIQLMYILFHQTVPLVVRPHPPPPLRVPREILEGAFAQYDETVTEWIRRRGEEQSVVNTWKQAFHNKSPPSSSSSLHTQYKKMSKGKKGMFSQLPNNMEEALWNWEDELKLSTKAAVVFFVVLATVAVGLLYVALKVARRREARDSDDDGVDPEPGDNNSSIVVPSSSQALLKQTGATRPPGCGVLKEVLMGSAQWSHSNKWEEEGRKRTPAALGLLLLACRRGGGGGPGKQKSHSSASAVWQRPILMGEKCELPRFSGLVLYDERGHPLLSQLHQVKFLPRPQQPGRKKEK